MFNHKEISYKKKVYFKIKKKKMANNNPNQQHIFQVRLVKENDNNKNSGNGLSGYLSISEDGMQLIPNNEQLATTTTTSSSSNTISDPSLQWNVTWNQIVLHAICTDLDAYPEPCIYCQIEIDGGEDDDNIESITQDIRLCPTKLTELRNIFDIMSQCAALATSNVVDEEHDNDFDDDNDDGDEDDGDMIMNDEEIINDNIL
jgi:hypothetical protein